MPDKTFFIGEWQVWEEDRDNPDHPVKQQQSFCIHEREGNAVALRFQPDFGDGCWNNHIRNGRFEDGRIVADIVDDGKCQPAPTTDTLHIEADVKEYDGNTRKRVRCLVLTTNGNQPAAGGPQIAWDPVEKEGEFGAEDQG